MKINKSTFIAPIVFATLIFTNNKVFAANLALSLGDLVTPPADATISGLCSNLKQCQPEDVITVSVPSGTSSRYVKNDTKFNLTKITYTILPEQDVVWDTASKFSFFKNQEISQDGKVLTFSNGVFPSGATGLFTRTGNIPVRITVFFEGQSNSKTVNESSMSPVLLMMGGLGIVCRNKMQKKKEIHN